MLFSSMTFIYVFLPIVCSIYLLVRNELKNHVLLIASLLFYAWGEPKYLAIMIFTILINYIFAILIEKARNQTKTNAFKSIFINKKLLLSLCIIANLSILGYFKYFNFLAENINYLFKSNVDFIKVIMPIGISFYTFQSISYVMDVYRGQSAQKDMYKLALYIALFPQLIAGPIVKYHEISAQIESRLVNFSTLSYGIKRFIIGLSKKMLIANTFGEIADKIFSANPDSFSPQIAWLGAICYTLQIYFDFSGYSDMAIGLGAIFGFKFPENFNYPYISKTISEFWRRWHISLSSWFREYLYIPLGGNRKGNKRTYFNLFLVFLATGVWHGAAWNFVIWGLYNGFFVIIERLLNLNKDTQTKPLYQRVLLHIYCILAFIIGWVLFRSPDLEYAIRYISNMFFCLDYTDEPFILEYYINALDALLLIFALIVCLPVFKNILYRFENSSLLSLAVNICIYALLIISTAQIAGSTYNPFIYFRF